METLIHDKLRRRKTFSDHCSKCYVLGTSFEHYRAWIMWTKETKTTRISGMVFHKHKYITNPDVTPEDRFIAEMDRMSQELEENPLEHLSNTKLEQLTTLDNILKQKSAYKNECGLPASHRLPTPPLFYRPHVPPLTPPRVPNATENTSQPPRVKPNRKLPSDAVPANRIKKPPRVGPSQRSAILVELVRQEEAETLLDDRPAHRTISGTVAQEAMFGCADRMKLNMSPIKRAGRKFPIETINTFLNEETGELMEYRKVMKNPKYRRLYEPEYSKELGRIAQVIPGQEKGADTSFFVDKGRVPVDRWRDITYGRVVVNCRPKQTTLTESSSDSAETEYTSHGTVSNQRWTCSQ